MATERRNAGARPQRLRDWPFGAVGRRLLLEALLLDPQPEDGWRKKDLERHAGLSNGALELLVAGAVDLELARLEAGRIWVSKSPPPLALSLATVLRETRGLPDRDVRPLPRRRYGEPS